MGYQDGSGAFMKQQAKKGRRKTIFIAAFGVLLAFALVVLPVAAVVAYEAFFGKRYETDAWLRFSAEDYQGLRVERSDFSSAGVVLAGYQYAKDLPETKGLVVIAHSIGGGHSLYLPFIDRFTSQGYAVFAYDARGHDNSGGDSMRGLPQGVIDLHHALLHTQSAQAYEGLPVALFGHSWGGYAVGSVLKAHPEVKAAVMVAGFDQSGSMLQHQGEQLIGAGVRVLMPYLRLYERIKFGAAPAGASAKEGMGKTNAGIMIVHSKDDAVVPPRHGYDIFHEAFGNSDRFQFVQLDDKGHSDLLYSPAALAYRERLAAGYQPYLEESGKEDSAQARQEYLTKRLNRKQRFEPDPWLMRQVLALFEAYCK